MTTPAIRYDLHTHSTASDGALSPAQLLARARHQQLQVLALTDHDTVTGVQQLQRQLQAEQATDITLISGTELTCLWQAKVIHIVGLGLDENSTLLQQYLYEVDQLRNQRAEKIALKLMKRNLPDLLDDARKMADGGVIGRPHFAAAMVARKLVKTEQQAFSHYLGSSKTGDVKMCWPDMEQAIKVIVRAGGVAVLAHPTKYRFTFTRIRALLSAFSAAGGKGLEVSYTGISPSHQLELIKLVHQYDLLASAGSDFHNPAHHWTEVGRFMPLKATAPHILDHLL
ncbi:MAG: PHP domain-containing protein [Marinobacterium sp.]|nr:PHP domain-containing protein [Marinobacterium sp.]